MALPFVLDASVALAWCFDDETTAFTDSVFQRMVQGGQAAVPPHWPVEVLNVLILAKRKGRTNEADIQKFLTELTSFHVKVDAVQDFSRLAWTRQLAEKYRLTSYDAAYLELAMRRGLPLASLDSDMRKAAKAEGVSLVEFMEPNVQ